MELPDAWVSAAKPGALPKEDAELPALELEHSKAIARLRYRTADNTLIVEFRNGTIYRYFGVPRDDYTRLATSTSPGARFNEFIQPYHEFERVV